MAAFGGRQTEPEQLVADAEQDAADGYLYDKSREHQCCKQYNPIESAQWAHLAARVQYRLDIPLGDVLQLPIKLHSQAEAHYLAEVL